MKKMYVARLAAYSTDFNICIHVLEQTFYSNREVVPTENDQS